MTERHVESARSVPLRPHRPSGVKGGVKVSQCGGVKGDHFGNSLDSSIGILSCFWGWLECSPLRRPLGGAFWAEWKLSPETSAGAAAMSGFHPAPHDAPAQDARSKMDRYSFLAGLFHPVLHVGLSRRFRLLNFYQDAA